MKHLALIMLACLLLFGVCQASEKDFLAYFDENALSDLKVWVEDIAERKILIMGEHHGVAENYDLYLKILESLPDEQIQLVIEMSPSFAFVCGQFLKTGDEALLKNSIAHLEGTFAFAQEHLWFWQGVKRIADGGKRIDIIGVDQEFQLKNFALALLLIDKDRFSPVLERIDAAGRIGGDALMETLGATVKEYSALPIEQEQDQSIHDIMLSLSQLLDNPMGEKGRDVPLYQTFARKVNPDISALGIFGGQHVAKTAQGTSMASLLKEDGRFGNKMAVAQLFYVDTSYMSAQSGEALPLQGLTQDSIMVQHALQQKARVAIYRLPPSPLFGGPGVRGLSLPSLYDYALIMKNAQATTSFDLK